jgi:hypothetical protein
MASSISIKPYAADNLDTCIPVRAASTWFATWHVRSRWAGRRLLGLRRRFRSTAPVWRSESERGGRLVILS